MDVFLSVRDPGYLLPIGGGLDGGVPGIGSVGRAPNRVSLRAGRNREGAAHDARRPEIVDDLQGDGAAGLRPGVAKSHSRLQVSNDNRYSESQFKTAQVQAGFPERFGSLQAEREVVLRRAFETMPERFVRGAQTARLARRGVGQQAQGQ